MKKSKLEITIILLFILIVIADSSVLLQSPSSQDQNHLADIKIKSNRFCTDDPSVILTECQNPRPTPETCPLPPFAPPGPPPSYCGITSKWQRINFIVQCMVCQSLDILFYFNRPCYDAPFICQRNQKCSDYYCSGKRCKSNQQCPYDWQACFSGRCIDKCNGLKCFNCKFGQCNYKQNPIGSCLGQQKENSCDIGQYSCYGSSCINDCLRHKCGVGQRCIPGPSCQKE